MRQEMNNEINEKLFEMQMDCYNRGTKDSLKALYKAILDDPSCTKETIVGFLKGVIGNEI